MKIDFKKELEAVSKGMIMIHDHKLLIKLILRMIVRKFGVKHAAMLIYDEERDTYVSNISRGEAGIKLPQGFTRFDHSNPIIQLFSRTEYKPLTVDKNAIVAGDINRLIWRESILDNGAITGSARNLLHRVEVQLELLNAAACVPAYYQKNLLAILLLGDKSDGQAYDEGELSFFTALASDAAMAIRNAQLFESLKDEAERNRKLFLQTISVLGATIEAKDSYTHGHTERVTHYAVLIAKQMQDSGVVTFTRKFLDNLYISGLLHDIGKIAVPESILNKEGGLTSDEYSIMKTHPAKGAEMVASLDLDLDIIDGIRHHHERYEGGGYPDGIKEEKIPMTAAIIAVADAFDAMTTDRSYRAGFSKEKAIKIVKENKGIQFHPLPAESMLVLFKKGMI
ncbi:MAG: putative nucleotidyltransferase with HDIG domain [Lysobacterales bacterium]|jgi:putative nucleotidyltransferase with HDIG domain